MAKGPLGNVGSSAGAGELMWERNDQPFVIHLHARRVMATSALQLPAPSSSSLISGAMQFLQLITSGWGSNHPSSSTYPHSSTSWSITESATVDLFS